MFNNNEYSCHKKFRTDRKKKIVFTLVHPLKSFLNFFV